jgi:hypothetical protein
MIMRIDLHCHSKYSLDNHLEPEALIERAYELGLCGVCFTEHSSVEASEPVLNLRPPDGFMIFRGVEISTNRGHLLAYGLDDDSWNRWGQTFKLDLRKTMESVRSLGGVCVPAHPFRGWESLGDIIFSMGGFAAIETHNGANPHSSNIQATEAAMKLGLPSIGGSDCHRVDQVGGAFTLMDNEVITIHDIVKEIMAGRCAGMGRHSDPWRS